MATQDNKDEIKVPEKISPVEEQAVQFKQEGEKTLEKQDTSQEDRIVTAELRQQIELMKLDPVNDKAAEVEIEKIAYLGEKEKIEHLLNLAKEKGGRDGLIFAVKTAQKMNEPYLLDLLHDSLIVEGLYKEYLNK